MCVVFSLLGAQVLATVAVFTEVAAAQHRGLVRKAADDAAKNVALIPADKQPAAATEPAGGGGGGKAGGRGKARKAGRQAAKKAGQQAANTAGGKAAGPCGLSSPRSTPSSPVRWWRWRRRR